MTQNADVLDLLIAQGDEGVTPLLAMTDLGIMRLAARISDLREMGYVITTYDYTTSTGKRVARYVLRHPEPVQLELAVGR